MEISVLAFFAKASGFPSLSQSTLSDMVLIHYASGIRVPLLQLAKVAIILLPPFSVIILYYFGRGSQNFKLSASNLALRLGFVKVNLTLPTGETQMRWQQCFRLVVPDLKISRMAHWLVQIPYLDFGTWRTVFIRSESQGLLRRYRYMMPKLERTSLVWPRQSRHGISVMLHCISFSLLSFYLPEPFTIRVYKYVFSFRILACTL